MSPPNRRSGIGDLNGWTVPLLKLNLVLIPILAGGMLTWGSWVTVETIKNAGHRSSEHYTEANAAKDFSDLREWVRDLVATIQSER
jgi:hypothetical protein